MNVGYLQFTLSLILVLSCHCFTATLINKMLITVHQNMFLLYRFSGIKLVMIQPTNHLIFKMTNIKIQM